MKDREEWVLGKQGHPFLLSFTPSQKEHQEALAWIRGKEEPEKYSCLPGAFFLATALASPLCLVSPVGSVSAESHVEAPGRTSLQKGSHTVPQTSAPQSSLSDLMIRCQNLFGDWLEARCLGRFSVK